MIRKFITYTIFVGLVLVGFTTSGQAQLAAVGPINPDNNFPFYYQDSGVGARGPLLLSLCLKNNGNCLLPGDVVLSNPALPFPDNYGGTFPDEAFYWTGDTDVVTAGGGTGLLVMALEAAFGNGPVADGDQIVFARIRFRIDNLVAGQSYEITTPFGIFNEVAAASGVRGINVTEDIGLVVGDFTAALDGKIGPFLTPTGFDPAAPTVIDAEGIGYIGDAVTPTTVTGSVLPVAIDFGTAGTPGVANFFRIVGPAVGVGSPNACTNHPAGPDNCVETNLFLISGQITGIFGVRPDRTTYTRGTTGNGRVDVFASAVPTQSIRAATAAGRAILLFEEPAGSGRYFGRFGFNGARPLPADKIISLTNLTDTPATTISTTITDVVNIVQAKFNTTGLDTTGTGTLTIRANSSDNDVANPVVLSVFGDDGTLIGTVSDNVATDFVIFPTRTVTVTSSAGGSATEDVLINGPNIRTIPLP